MVEKYKTIDISDEIWWKPGHAKALIEDLEEANPEYDFVQFVYVPRRHQLGFQEELRDFAIMRRTEA